MSIYFNLLQSIFGEIFLSPTSVWLQNPLICLKASSLQICKYETVFRIYIYIVICIRKIDILIGFLFIAILFIPGYTFTLCWGNLDYEKSLDNKIIIFLWTLSLHFNLVTKNSLAGYFVYSGWHRVPGHSKRKVWTQKMAQIRFLELVHCNFHLHCHTLQKWEDLNVDKSTSPSTVVKCL